ncbi:MAG: hypothetical protein OEZ06_05465 [Myxococcales bacterium]|nr:hypothetical protein [Myxococcales bacterium]
MSGAVSDAGDASDAAREAGAAERDAKASPGDDYQDPAPSAFEPHVASGPPLAWLAALSAFAAMAINQVLLPAFSDPANRTALLRLARWGDFATNLATVAGLIALSFGLVAFIRHSTAVSLRQRLLLASFSGMFVPAIAVATLFERQRTTAQIVLFAIGAAHVLGFIVNASAARSSEQRVAKAVAVMAATLSALTLVAQALHESTRVTLGSWQLMAYRAISGTGEIFHLLLLLGLSLLVLPPRQSARDRLSRAAAFFLLPVVLGSLYAAERHLPSDYTLLLYHAQRVNLFIDSFPRLYSIPLGLALSAVLAAGISDNSARRQGGAALFLLVSSAHAPHAPGRLLTLALAMVLIARTVLAPPSAQPATARERAGNGGDQT